MVIDQIIAGIIENWMIVGISLLMLVGGTLAAYQKHGLKRVLLGKRHDGRELIYRVDGRIDWKPTLDSWLIIITGGMSLLSVFLIMMLLALSFIYQYDMKSTRDNDELLCKTFGTTIPTTDQLEEFYENNENRLETSSINFSGIKVSEGEDG